MLSLPPDLASFFRLFNPSESNFKNVLITDVQWFGYSATFIYDLLYIYCILCLKSGHQVNLENYRIFACVHKHLSDFEMDWHLSM